MRTYKVYGLIAVLKWFYNTGDLFAAAQGKYLFTLEQWIKILEEAALSFEHILPKLVREDLARQDAAPGAIPRFICGATKFISSANADNIVAFNEVGISFAYLGAEKINRHVIPPTKMPGGYLAALAGHAKDGAKKYNLAGLIALLGDGWYIDTISRKAYSPTK